MCLKKFYPYIVIKSILRKTRNQVVDVILNLNMKVSVTSSELYTWSESLLTRYTETNQT